MTRKHYIVLATLTGQALAIAIHAGQHDNFYNDVYVPLVEMLAADNPHFDRGRFAYATATAEESYRKIRDLSYPDGARAFRFATGFRFTSSA